MQTHITNPQQIFSEHESNEIPQKIDDVHFTTARAASQLAARPLFSFRQVQATIRNHMSLCVRHRWHLPQKNCQECRSDSCMFTTNMDSANCMLFAWIYKLTKQLAVKRNIVCTPHQKKSDSRQVGSSVLHILDPLLLYWQSRSLFFLSDSQQ